MVLEGRNRLFLQLPYGRKQRRKRSPLSERQFARELKGAVAKEFFPHVTGYQAYAPKLNSPVEIRDPYGVKGILVLRNPDVPRIFP